MAIKIPDKLMPRARWTGWVLIHPAGLDIRNGKWGEYISLICRDENGFTAEVPVFSRKRLLALAEVGAIVFAGPDSVDVGKPFWGKFEEGRLTALRPA